MLNQLMTGVTTPNHVVYIFLKIILNQNSQVCLKQLHLLCGEPPLLSFVGDIEINFRATKSSTQSISENQWQFQEPKLEIPTGTI
jgi:hypothetical protein